MRKTVAVSLPAVLVAGCHLPVKPEVLGEFKKAQLFLCCNLYYERAEISDANYHVGTRIPFGTPVQIQGMTSNSVTFAGGGTALTLYHAYGADQESGPAYFAKVLVHDDPRAVVASYSDLARKAVEGGRVERGMTREQVLISLGNPPTHETSSLSAPVWRYWFNRWTTFDVAFGADGRVETITGPAPTGGIDIP